MMTINSRSQLAILNFFYFFFSFFVSDLSWQNTNETRSRCHFVIKTLERRQNKIVCFFYHFVNHFVVLNVCVIENSMKFQMNVVIANFIHCHLYSLQSFLIEHRWYDLNHLQRCLIVEINFINFIVCIDCFFAVID